MRLSFLGVVALVACGDNLQAPVIEELRALPGVADVTETETQTAGYQYFVLHFRQPVDHHAPGATFLQEVSLLHRDRSSPMIAWTSGYFDYYLDHPVELTTLLGANQISIEHRYFAESRPEPADWSKLTIEQMAADEHAIISALRTVYDGAFITAGGSKGGMTAIYHRRFFPDDVDGTVPYVAPTSFGAPDLRYPAFLDTVGTPECRQAVRDVAVEMLANRRAAMTEQAQIQAAEHDYVYARIQLDPAVESAVFSLEWSFWQYYGLESCPEVPATTASDLELFGFLDMASPVSDNSDERIAQFEAYGYQAYFQLGYPDVGAAYLDPYLRYTDADYINQLPTAQPEYDGAAAMLDIDQFVRERGERFLFIYGEWDPWTGGAYELGGATDSLRLIQSHGTHNSRITRLAAADRAAALAKLEAWTGVAPKISTARSTHDAAESPTRDEPRLPHPPSAFTRALRGRRLSP